MRLFRFRSIQTNLTVWFLLLILIALISVLTVTYFQQVSIIESKTTDKLIAIRDLKVIELENWLSERSSDLHTISVDKELTDLEYVINKTSFDEEDNEILENSRSILNRYLKNYPAYYELFIIDPVHARILISTNRLMEGEDRASDDYFVNAMESKSISFKDIYYSTTLEANSMAFSIPIFCEEHSGEHIVGILVARIDLENLLYKMLLNRVGLGTTGETLIVNENVMVLNDLRWYDDAPFKLKISTKSAVRAAAGETGVVTTNDYRGQEVLAAYTYIPETGWGFICKQDVVELNASVNEMLVNLILLFIVTVIIAFFVIYIVSKTITKPIVDLNQVAQKIKAGDLSARSLSTSMNELGELSLVFNNMADAIELRMKTQKEVSDISETMIKQTSLHEFSTSLLKHMMKLTGAKISIFYILNEGTSEYDHFVSFGINKELIKSVNQNQPEDEFKNTIANKEISYLIDISKYTEEKYKAVADGVTPEEIITIPVLVDGLIIALITIVNENVFSNISYEVLKQSWHSVNVSYSNLLSNERTRILSESLIRTIEQLEIKSEKLKKQSVELEQSSDELKLVVDKLEITNKELEAFSYSVSHDLRAPLRHVDGFTKLLHRNLKDKIDETSQKYFDNIISSSKQMNKLIDDLLVFSRTGRKEVNKTSVNMKTIIDEALRSFSSDLHKSKITILIDEMPDVNVDMALIVQVWINLISNAIKFTGNTTSPEIHIGTEKGTKGNTVFFIKDNGAGFDQKYVDKIFGVFQRLHNVNEFPGTGIGLANVKRIIVKHGGNVRAEGKVNKGAAFFFKLPKD